MNLANQPVRAVPKTTQHKRIKPTQKQMGAISLRVDRELKERSGFVCERCHAARATERAHLIRRGKLTARTTVNDLVHLCSTCHDWADESGLPGRAWLKMFRASLMAGSAGYGERFED